ncbi:ABC transporter permease, partial [Vineibacter terrae]|uniref:ABC transporter permease n=1 Tax=Vineibacter terrae TaxID=2586908 RepID=UPI002E33331F
MLAYVARRIAATIPVVGVVVFTVFLLLHQAPGDPAAIIAGDSASPDDIARIRLQLGLERSLWVQFGEWVAKLSHGDLGQSIYSHTPVTHMIAQSAGPTIALTIVTTALAVLIAVPLGVMAAWRAGSWADHAVMVAGVACFSLPVFLTGYALIYVFAQKLALLPVQGYMPLREGLWPFLRHLILPSACLASVYIALVARMTRAAMLETLGEDYIRTARAKGLGEAAVLLVHALKNAAVPIVTVIGLGIAFLIGGVVVTESVFA